MCKKTFFVLVFNLCLCCLGFAQTEERLTVTTYYPSPMGKYAQLETTTKTVLATTDLGADPNSMVGIGTANPGAKLEIGNSGDLLFKATAVDPGDIIFQNADGSQKARIWAWPNDASSGLLMSSGDNTADIFIASDGDVGIGTTSPAATYKLDVQGTIQATAFDVGDITFRDQKTQKIIWRMFEDEEGLYLENVKTGKIYRFALQETNKSK